MRWKVWIEPKVSRISARRFRSAGRTLFDFHATDIDQIFQLFGVLLEIFGNFNNGELDQGRTANRLLHAQLTAFHAAGEFDFAFAGKQRDGAHFAQIYANRIVGIDRLFDLLLGLEEIRFRFGIEKLRLFVEVDRNRSYRKKLIIIFHRKSPPAREDRPKLRGYHSCLLFCYFYEC